MNPTDTDNEDDITAGQDPSISHGADDGGLPATDISRPLGIARWVQFGYIALFALSFWLFDRITTVVWDQFAEPNAALISGIAAAIAGLITLVMWRSTSIRSFAQDSAGELAKVTWPNKKETWSNTVVVIVTSVIASLILFTFDAAWSAITDMIYQ